MKNILFRLGSEEEIKNFILTEDKVIEKIEIIRNYFKGMRSVVLVDGHELRDNDNDNIKLIDGSASIKIIFFKKDEEIYNTVTEDCGEWKETFLKLRKGDFEINVKLEEIEDKELDEDFLIENGIF